MFKIIFNIFHFFGIGYFYTAKVKIVSSFTPIVITYTINSYSFSRNPMKQIKKKFKNFPSILIESIEIIKIW